MADKRARHKGRKNHGSYSAWPHACAEHENFAQLSTTARALLFEFLGQYRGNNNGDLCCAFSLLKRRGWKSRDTIERARTELEKFGWIVRSRQGGRNAPNLYALTFIDIHECGGKLEIKAGPPLGTWKQKQFDMPGNRSTLARRSANPCTTAGQHPQ